MQKCFIILGAARSGTSLTAGLLHRMGVVMGWRLPNEDGKPRFDWPDPLPMNPRGFYQDAPLENLHDDIWGDDYPESGSVVSHESRHYQETFNKLLLLRQSQGNARWGFKVSRSAWVMDDILQNVSNPYFVVTQRDKHESALSMNHWFHYGMPTCLRWMDRVAQQIDLTLNRYSDIPKLVLPFSGWFTETSTQLSRLANFTGFVGEVGELSQFIDPSLNRFSK